MSYLLWCLVLVFYYKPFYWLVRAAWAKFAVEPEKALYYKAKLKEWFKEAWSLCKWQSGDA